MNELKCLRYETELKEEKIGNQKYLFLCEHNLRRFTEKFDGDTYEVRCCVEHFMEPKK